MGFGFVGTKNGSTHDLNLTYTVVYHTSTTYKVSLNYALNRASKTATMWIFDNGTVLSLYAKGENYTGSTANNIVLNYFSDLETLNIFALQASSDALYFHSTGNTTTQIGTNSFPVTEYGTNTSPEKIQGCGAESGVLNTYNVYLGTPTGSSLKLVTYASFSGSLTTASGTTTEDYTYQLTALTVS